MSEPLKERDFKLLALNYLVTLCPIVLFAWMLKWPAVLALAPVGLLSFLFKRPLKFLVLRWFASAVFIAGVMTLYKTLLPIPEHIIINMLYPELYTHAFMGIAVMCLFYEQKAVNIGLSILFSYVSIVMAGAKGMGFGYEHMIFFAGTVVYMAALLLMLRRMRYKAEYHKRSTLGRSKGLRIFVSLTVFALALMMVFPISKLFFGVYNYIEAKTYNLFKFQPPAGQLSSSLNMWNSPPKDWDRESAVVLRVCSDKCPEYMRGYTFERYTAGRWIHKKGDEQLRSTRVNDRINRFTYIQQDQVEGDTVGVQLAKGLANGNVLLAPGNTVEIQAMASEILRDRNNAFFPAYDNRKDGRNYDLRVAFTNDPAHAGPGFVNSEDPGYLQVPPQLNVVLDAIAVEVLQLRPVHEVSETEIMNRLSLYFLNNYRYELGVKFAGSRDPIEQFVTEKRKGHCTLFAATSVLVLRRMGIPSRVVTGYVCVEPHTSGGYWLARVNCAHAWAEAYSKEQKRWVLVENTPAASLPTGESQFNFMTSIADYLSWHWRLLIASLRAGGIKAALIQLVISISAGLAWLASNVLLMLSIILLITSLAAKKIYFRHIKRKRDEVADGQTIILLQTLKKIDARLKKLGVVREPQMTINEHIDKVRQSEKEGADSLADLLVRYEVLRYRQKDRTDESVRDFGKSVDLHT